VVDLVELNPKFAACLERLIQRDRPEQRGVDCRLHTTDFLARPKSRQYDYIISGLPLANFEPATVTRILDAFLDHLAPHGVLSYFEYSHLHRLRLHFLKPLARERVTRSADIVKKFLQQHQFECRHVWLNLPPAYARHCRKQVRG
jgi:phospholipid N-methyltransferase